MTKKQLKGIIKECIREIVFEENFLSPLISEIATGVTAGKQIIDEAKTNTPKPNEEPNYSRLAETRKRLLDGIGGETLGGVDVFKDVSADRVQQKDKGNPGISMTKLSEIPGLARAAGVVKAIKAKR